MAVPRLLYRPDLFGRLLLQTPAWLPNLRAVLPTMPPDDVQISWTGAAGTQLLQQSVAYYRTVRFHLCGMDWQKATIADYGCGRGRLNGDVTYGDASVSLAYIRTNWTEWELSNVDFNLIDPHQIIVFLRPI